MKYNQDVYPLAQIVFRAKPTLRNTVYPRWDMQQTCSMKCAICIN